MNFASLVTAIGFLSLTAVSFGQLAPDGFPTGQKIPEGVACDLARAFIKKDAALFTKSVLPAASGKTDKAYAAFLTHVKQGMLQEAKKAKPSPGAPKQILICYAARKLSKSGPGSYAYTAHGFKDVEFVDVKVKLQDGKTYLNRTLVVQDKNGMWLVHPRPDLSPLLSEGLNEEKPSIAVYRAKAATKHRG